MFNFKEIHLIHDALQNSPMIEERTEVIKKLCSMVSNQTFQWIASCVRPRDVDGVKVDPRERMKVFETERELHRDIEEIVMNAYGKGRRIQIVISVPNSGLADKIGEHYRYTGVIKGHGRPPQFPLGVQSRIQDYQYGEDFRIMVVDRHNNTCGMSIDWAFFYNEVAGF